MDESLSLLVIACVVFLLAGGVKGLLGVGFPTISMAILTQFVSLPVALQIVLVPTLATNIWQSCDGPHLLTVIKRLWLFYAMNMLLAWLAWRFVLLSWPEEMKVLLGVLLCIYAAFGLGFKPIRFKPDSEPWASPLCGAITGFFAGTTGNTQIPAMAFLDSLRLERDAMIQAMGLTFGLPMLAIGIGMLASGDSFDGLPWWLLLIAMFPAFLGMWLGKRFRHVFSEATFRKLLFGFLLIVGVKLVVGYFL